jgi:hypothetical protein
MGAALAVNLAAISLIEVLGVALTEQGEQEDRTEVD